MNDAEPIVPAQASGGQIARGAAWMLLFKLADKGVGLLSTLILARLLVPADFGLVAMASAVVALTQLLNAFGFDTALIQRQDARREHYDTAWTFNVVFGAVIAALLFVLAVPAGHFYRDDRLAPILFVLGAGALLGGFENIGTVAFRKDLDFKSEFRFLLIKRLAAFVVTIGIALAYQSYWALIAGTVTGRALSVWISFRLHPFRPRLSLAARHDLMHFSKWLLISSAIQFAQARSTDFILGRTVGPHGLGVYSIAFEIATMPSTELIAPVNRAVYPAYARLSTDLPQLRQRFVEVFSLICLVAVPIAAVLFGVADAAVRVVLGSKWLESVDLIRVFAVCGLVGALQSNLYLMIMAMGQPRANTLLSGAVLAVSLPVIVWASIAHGVMGAAVAQLAASLVGLVGIVLVFRRICGVGLRVLARAVARPALAGLVLVPALWQLDGLLAQSWPALPRLLLLLAASAIIVLAVLVAAWQLAGRPPGAEATVLDFARRRLQQRKQAQALR
jgi:lipopolysaccharide exporter